MIKPFYTHDNTPDIAERIRENLHNENCENCGISIETGFFLTIHSESDTEEYLCFACLKKAVEIMEGKK